LLHCQWLHVFERIFLRIISGYMRIIGGFYGNELRNRIIGERKRIITSSLATSMAVTVQCTVEIIKCS